MKNISRISFGIILIGSVFYAPWWVLAVVSVIGVCMFPRYIEVVIAGALYDILYGATGVGVMELGGVGGIVSSAFVLIITERIKKEIRR